MSQRLLIGAWLCIIADATFSGGVYFLPVPPKPASEGDTKQAADAATMTVQRELLRKLRFTEVAKDPATVREWKQELAVVFARADTSYLLVLDDVWDPCILNGLRCPAMKGVILVTARDSVCSGLLTVHLKPDDRSKQAAKALMVELLASAEYKNQVGVHTMCDACMIQQAESCLVYAVWQHLCSVATSAIGMTSIILRFSPCSTGSIKLHCWLHVKSVVHCGQPLTQSL